MYVCMYANIVFTHKKTKTLIFVELLEGYSYSVDRVGTLSFSLFFLYNTGYQETLWFIRAPLY